MNSLSVKDKMKVAQTLNAIGPRQHVGNEVESRSSSQGQNKFQYQVRLNFAQKLYEILDNPQYSDTIKWLPGGKSWIIMDKRAFTTEILPLFFKQTQFTSFTRKLSRWKFQRVNKGPYMGAYHHKLFRKDKKYLCLLMSCNKEPPTLAVVARVRQLAISEGDYRAAALAAADLPEAQKSALKSLEDMNKTLIKQQIMKLRMQKLLLLEQNKQILIDAEERNNRILINAEARINQTLQLRLQQSRQNQQLVNYMSQPSSSIYARTSSIFPPNVQSPFAHLPNNVFQQQSLKHISGMPSQVANFQNHQITDPSHYNFKKTDFRSKVPGVFRASAA